MGETESTKPAEVVAGNLPALWLCGETHMEGNAGSRPIPCGVDG